MINEEILEVLEVTSKYHFKIFLANIHDVPKLTRMKDCRYYIELAEENGFIENLKWTIGPNEYGEFSFFILNDESNPIRKTDLGEQVLKYLNEMFPQKN